MDQREEPGRRRRRLRTGLLVGGGIASTLVLILVILLLFFSELVTGPSMQPLLRSGDRVLVNPLAYRLGTPSRGDVVTLDPPAGPRGTAVKRIVALPGDEIEIRAGETPGVLLRPGGRGPWLRPAEPYLGRGAPARSSCCDASGRASDRPAPFTVPPGHYFVLGDNRSVSYDSRDYGPVPGDDITGQVVWRVFPLVRFGAI